MILAVLAASTGGAESRDPAVEKAFAMLYLDAKEVG